MGLWILMDSGLAPRHGAAGIRLAHASPDAAHASVSVDGKVLVAGIPSRQVSQYAAIGTGGHAVKLLFLGAQAPVLDVGELDFQAGANYTLFLVGVRAATPPMAAFVARDRVS